MTGEARQEIRFVRSSRRNCCEGFDCDKFTSGSTRSEPNCGCRSVAEFMNNRILSSFERVADLNYGETSWAILFQVFSPLLNLIEQALVTITIQGRRHFRA